MAVREHPCPAALRVSTMAAVVAAPACLTLFCRYQAEYVSHSPLLLSVFNNGVPLAHAEVRQAGARQAGGSRLRDAFVLVHLTC